MKKLFVFAAMAAFPVSGVHAQSSGFYISGFSEIEHIETDNNSETGFYTDFTIGLDPSAAGSPLPVGVEVSLEAFEFDGENESALFASVFYDSAFGRFSIGAPTPVIDDYVVKPRIGRNNLLDRVVLAPVSQSATYTVHYLLDENAVGLRYDGEFGAAKLGISVHDFDDIDAQAYLAAVGFDEGTFDAALGIEYLDTPGDSETGAYGSVGGTFGQFYADLFLARTIIIDDTTAQVTLGYDVLPNLNVEASYLTVSGEDLDALSLGAEYTFWQNAYAGVSYTDTDATGEDILDLSLGWKLNY